MVPVNYRRNEAHIIGRIDNLKKQRPTVKRFFVDEDKKHKRKPRTRTRHYG